VTQEKQMIYAILAALVAALVAAILLGD